MDGLVKKPFPAFERTPDAYLTTRTYLVGSTALARLFYQLQHGHGQLAYLLFEGLMRRSKSKIHMKWTISHCVSETTGTYMGNFRQWNYLWGYNVIPLTFIRPSKQMATAWGLYLGGPKIAFQQAKVWSRTFLWTAWNDILLRFWLYHGLSGRERRAYNEKRKNSLLVSSISLMDDLNLILKEYGIWCYAGTKRKTLPID